MPITSRLLEHAPTLDPATASVVAQELYGLRITATALPSERDQNFLLTTDSGDKFVLKIANALEQRELLEAQNEVLSHLEQELAFCPRVIATTSGEQLGHIKTPTRDAGEPAALAPKSRSDTSRQGSQLERMHFVRLVTYLPGKPLAEIYEHTPDLLRDLGRKLGQLDQALARFDHPALHRDFHWDLANGLSVINQCVPLIADPELQALVQKYAEDFQRKTAPLLPRLRLSIIHNDANDYNVLVGGDSDSRRVVGLIDFGDLVHSYAIADLAVCIAYAMLDEADPLAAAAPIVAGYHEESPLNEDEIESLYGLALLRLCMSVCLAAYQQQQSPENEYLKISQLSIKNSMTRLTGIDSCAAAASFRQACKLTVKSETLAARKRLLGRNLSIAYKNPIKVVRGEMQYLYDESGRQFLDAYNNVAHVGHCHPRVVKAGQQQMALLNTNTRYLNDSINQYAERLISTLPAPMRVCYFVNSGSEANELALRLARAHTNQKDLIVLDHAYHGNTTSLIDISPYKHDGPGGRGAPAWVHKVPLPDIYRGLYDSNEPDATQKYAQHVDEVIARLRHRGVGISGFIAESLPSVAGQIVLPPGYLSKVYELVHRAGGLCIADEVQTGYGRIGTHFWGFQSQEVVPDIVVLGKPIGNGHPIGAVITTVEIADSFDNGMEFFSTFGGNTVSCAIGLTVLDVVLEENLQAHALSVGEKLLHELRALREQHDVIGDIRGSGLFLGVELVRDRKTREPATVEAETIVNGMRDKGILLGTDGPFHNVLKIRPPMPFSSDDAQQLSNTLDQILKCRSGVLQSP